MHTSNLYYFRLTLTHTLKIKVIPKRKSSVSICTQNYARIEHIITILFVCPRQTFTSHCVSLVRLFASQTRCVFQPQIKANWIFPESKARQFWEGGVSFLLNFIAVVQDGPWPFWDGGVTGNWIIVNVFWVTEKWNTKTRNIRGMYYTRNTHSAWRAWMHRPCWWRQRTPAARIAGPSRWGCGWASRT